MSKIRNVAMQMLFDSAQVSRRLFARGWTVMQIAAARNLRPETVRRHLGPSASQPDTRQKP